MKNPALISIADGVSLCSVQTDRFKTCKISVSAALPLDGDIAAAAVLVFAVSAAPADQDQSQHDPDDAVVVTAEHFSLLLSEGSFQHMRQRTDGAEKTAPVCTCLLSCIRASFSGHTEKNRNHKEDF